MAFIINGVRIEDEEIAEEFESIKEHYQAQGEVVCCDRDEEFQQYARDNVVNRTLMEQESVKRFGEVSDDAVAEKFEEIKAEHGGEKEFYDNTGLNKGDEAMIIRRLKSSMTVDRLMDDELPFPEAPSEEALEAYYQENIARFMSEEEVRVSQIFVEPSSHEAAREAFVALRDLRRELLEGKDFDVAAQEHGSDDRDTDLGFMKQGDTMPEIEAITFSMEIGEISPVVATHYGFHLFKVTEKKAPAPIPKEEIPTLGEQLLTEQRNNAIQAVIDKLRDQGDIKEVESE